jgi:hypothetical protein
VGERAFPDFGSTPLAAITRRALRPDCRQQLKSCHDELDFRYVRFHGILSGDVRRDDGVVEFDVVLAAMGVPQYHCDLPQGRSVE